MFQVLCVEDGAAMIVGFNQVQHRLIRKIGQAVAILQRQEDSTMSDPPGPRSTG